MTLLENDESLSVGEPHDDVAYFGVGEDCQYLCACERGDVMMCGRNDSCSYMVWFQVQ